MYLRIVLASLTSLVFTTSVLAKGVSINPGLWQMTSTVKMSLLPQPQVRTYSECIEESELSPEDFNKGQDSPCEISGVIVAEDTIRWSIRCPVDDAVTMDGQWEFTSRGDSISGSGSMAADSGGMKLDIEMNWEGKRIGDCP